MQVSSDVILNLFAVFACRADDGNQYQALRSSLDKRFSSVAWSAKYSREFCDKKFADVILTAARVEAERQLTLNPTPVVALGRMRLGMTSKDLLATKGPPITQQDKHWAYNIGDSQHNGVITVVFSASTNDPVGIVVAIEFVGDRESAPSELPYLNGFSEDNLRDQFGSLIGMASPTEDVTSLRYRNGVYADTRNGRVFQYGIYVVKVPH